MTETYPSLPDGWTLVHTRTHPGRSAEYVSTTSLNLSPRVEDYLKATYPRGIYRHQEKAIQAISKDQSVCIATGTSSGKTLPFQVSALERIALSRKRKVLALYPTRALATEQEERWQRTLEAFDPSMQVRNIHSGIPTRSRSALLEGASVVLLTPDLVHAWLLSNLQNRRVRSWVANLDLLIIDEIHTYTGVMGSNAAFLFRRLRHCVRKLQGEEPRIFASSATLASPRDHVRKLTGVDVVVVDESSDSSPRLPLTTHLVEHPSGGSPEVIGKLLVHLAHLGQRFIAFAESRKVVEMTQSILERADELIKPEGSKTVPLKVQPYRSGYEDSDRKEIQRQLNDGILSGVISTSALELGLDISGLDTAVLLGTPRTATSFNQRIGRVGRNRPGQVLVVNTGTTLDRVSFHEPDRVFQRPPAESALYLTNQRIQYIHALCLIGEDGEDEAVSRAPDSRARNRGEGEETPFHSDITWPPGFEELCVELRSGSVPYELRHIHREALSNSGKVHWVFPLRDVEQQFEIVVRNWQSERPLGSIGQKQLMREAYPGAIYYHRGKPYRVTWVDWTRRKVEVRPDRQYITRPITSPSRLYLDPRHPQDCRGMEWHGGLTVLETEMQVRDRSFGWEERRGGADWAAYNYPVTGTNKVRYDRPSFNRHYWTTGVVATHPILNSLNQRQGQLLARGFLEALLLHLPFERQDLDAGFDRIRGHGHGLPDGQGLLAIYDQTYGSLMLSSRAFDEEVFRWIVESAPLTLDREQHEAEEKDLEAVRHTCEIILGILRSSAPRPFQPEGSVLPPPMPERYMQIILPGGKGVRNDGGYHEVEIERVYFNVRQSRLMYGYRSDEPGASKQVAVDFVDPLPGESRIGHYDLEEGRVLE